MSGPAKSRQKSPRDNLVPGAGRGPKKGEGGRPPSLIRQQLRGTFTERIGFLNSVIDGVPMLRMRIPLRSLGPHCVCANCGEREIQADSPESAVIEVEVMASASINDRLKAMDMLAKYGLGTSNEIHDDRGAEQLPTVDERRARVMAIVK